MQQMAAGKQCSANMPACLPAYLPAVWSVGMTWYLVLWRQYTVGLLETIFQSHRYSQVEDGQEHNRDVQHSNARQTDCSVE